MTTVRLCILNENKWIECTVYSADSTILAIPHLVLGSGVSPGGASLQIPIKVNLLYQVMWYRVAFSFENVGTLGLALEWGLVLVFRQRPFRMLKLLRYSSLCHVVEGAIWNTALLG